MDQTSLLLFAISLFICVLRILYKDRDKIIDFYADTVYNYRHTNPDFEHILFINIANIKQYIEMCVCF